MDLSGSLSRLRSGRWTGIALFQGRKTTRFLPGKRAGFSLVEVTLAMGIASFAMIVIFSMLPTGMASTQDSSRQIAESEIFTRIGSELTSTAFYNDVSLGSTPSTSSTDYTPTVDVLADYVGTATARFPAYFDDEGNEVKSGAPNIVYTVRCALTPPPTTVWTPSEDNNNNFRDPNSTGNSVKFYELRYAKILIGYHADPDPSPGATPNPAVKQRIILLANKGG